MININDSLNFLNPLKAIGSFLKASTFNWTAAIGAVVSYASKKSAAKKMAAGQAAAQGSAERRESASLEEQKRQFDLGQKNLQPYQKAGLGGLEEYQRLLSDYKPQELPEFAGEYKDPGAFTGEVDLESDPGYQFRKEQGLQAIDRMKARGGERFSGARGAALQQYGQNLASQEYGAAYGRSLSQYGIDVQRAGSDYQRQLGEYGLQYGRAQDIDRQKLGQLGQYANLAASGQQAAGSLSNLGANYASATSNIRGSAGEAIGRAQVGQAQANAAGSLALGNTITSGLGAYQYQQNFNQVYGGQGTGASYYGQAAPTSAVTAGDAYMPAYRGQ